MLVVDDTIGLVVDDTMSDHTMPLASCQMVDDMVAMTFMSFLYGLFHKDRDFRSLTKLFTNVANEQGCVRF